MHADARITLYGGFTIGVALVALGMATVHAIAVTGFGIVGAALFVALLFEHSIESAA